MTDNQPTTSLRTYRHRITKAEFAAVLITAAAAFACLWTKTAGSVAAGLFLMATTVLQVERLVHTSYALTPDDTLTVNRGRFSRRLTIPINEILTAKAVVTRPFMQEIILIEYGARRVTSIKPMDCNGFLSELGRRQKTITINVLGDKA